MSAEKKSTKKTMPKPGVKKSAPRKTPVYKKDQAKKEDFRSEFLSNLATKKNELESLLERLIGSQKEYDSQHTAGEFIDELDDAQREISTRNLYSLIERKTKELRRIEFLMKRVASDGKFGLCEECGRRIPKERLMIVPDATLCVQCQREMEKVDSRRSLWSKGTANLGTRKDLDWDSTDDLEDEGYVVKISPSDDFSLADIQETEPDDAAMDKD